jgi:hypothetical protein
MSFVRNSLVALFAALSVTLLVQGCLSGDPSEGGDPGSVDDSVLGAAVKADSAISPSDAGTADSATSPPDAGGDGCADAGALTVLVPPGGTVTRPPQKVLRITFVYRGSQVSISNLFGANMTLPPSDGPLQPGVNSGYWAELQGATGQTLFTRRFQDPTRLEVPPPPPPSDGGFSNVTIPECDAKFFFLSLPNNLQAKRVVIFGNGYGSTGVAQELGRFTLP